MALKMRPTGLWPRRLQGPPGLHRLLRRAVEAGAATAVDMVGRVVGRLTVLERAGSVQLYGDMSAALWRCRCRCGNEVVLPG